MIKPSALSLASAMTGYKNYESKSYSTTIPAQTLAAFEFKTYIATTTFSRSDTITETQVKYGVDSFWQVIDGTVVRRYPSWTATNYEVGSLVYFSGNTQTVYTFIFNQTGGPLAVPSIPIDCRTFFYKAPV